MNIFKQKLLLILSIALILCIAFTGCSSNKDDSEKTLYAVKIESQGKLPLEDVTVEIYKDAEVQNLLWAAETDKNGAITFNADSSKVYYAVLKELPSGYNAESVYEINSSDAVISLKAVLGDAGDMSGAVYELGSIVHDFTVTATDGKKYTVSDLLKTKKAIVLNFWYIGCQPCKMEFPFLQQAYTDYQNDIEVIAINPYDGTNDKVAAYAVENGLTFPMVSTDYFWESLIQLTAYPTTVVIDRYGTVCMIHKGSVTSKEEFTNIFEFFTADNYEQTLIRNISDIE